VLHQTPRPCPSYKKTSEKGAKFGGSHSGPAKKKAYKHKNKTKTTNQKQRKQNYHAKVGPCRWGRDPGESAAKRSQNLWTHGWALAVKACCCAKLQHSKTGSIKTHIRACRHYWACVGSIMDPDTATESSQRAASFRQLDRHPVRARGN